MATVLQLSDIHYPAAPGELFCGRDSVARLEAVLDACRRLDGRPDLVLLGGDQTHDGAVEANQRLRECLTERLGAPLLAIAGNHDDPDVRGVVFGPPDAREVGAWRVLGWDTRVAGADHGRVDVEALAVRLDGLDDRPTLLAIHHPPAPPTPNPIFRLECSEELLSMLASRPHVRGVVSGHVHTPFELRRDGLRLLGAPAVSAPFRHCVDGRFTVDEDGPTGARMLFLENDGGMTSEMIEA